MKSLFTPAESSTLILAAYAVQQDSDIENYLTKIERILLDKMFESSETTRLLGLSPKSS
jgi:hypothetical protein